MDRLSPDRRAANMRAIRAKDTAPEMEVRRLAHALGYRFRLHRRNLPGSPDLVFPRRRKVVFVHGCYWHRHAGCQFAYTPKSNADFWLQKFEGNQQRDQRALDRLQEAGWDSLIVWECETRDRSLLAARLQSFLGPR